MIRTIALLCALVVLSITGCAVTSQNQALVSIAVRNISCDVAPGSSLDISIRTIWESVKLGSLTEYALSQMMKLTTDRPTLAADLIDLVGLMGVSFDPTTGEVFGIETISPKMFAAIEKAYGQGQRMCN